MSTIVNEISTTDLAKDLEKLNKSNVHFSIQENVYVTLNGEDYIVKYKGEKINKSATPKKRESNIFVKEISDEDVHDRVLSLAKEND